MKRLVFIIMLFNTLKAPEKEQALLAKSQVVIHRVPQQTLPPPDHTQECLICFKKMVGKQSQPVAVIQCERPHVFHQECLAGWLQNNPTCPICRTPVDKNSASMNKNKGFLAWLVSLIGCGGGEASSDENS